MKFVSSINEFVETRDVEDRYTSAFEKKGGKKERGGRVQKSIEEKVKKKKNGGGKKCRR